MSSPWGCAWRKSKKSAFNRTRRGNPCSTAVAGRAAPSGVVRITKVPECFQPLSTSVRSAASAAEDTTFAAKMMAAAKDAVLEWNSFSMIAPQTLLTRKIECIGPDASFAAVAGFRQSVSFSFFHHGL
jgi:hypothetical protein